MIKYEEPDQGKHGEEAARVHVKEHVGIVVSDRMQKTVIVAVEDRARHPRYKKILARTKRYKAHDETNRCREGDRVRIYETKPLSKTKRWVVDKVIEHAEHPDDKAAGRAGNVKSSEVKSSHEVLAHFKMINRHIEAHLPKKVWLNQPCALEIRISNSHSDEVRRAGNRARIAAYVSVSDSDFYLDSPRKIINIPLDPVDWVEKIRLIPKREGTKFLEVSFFQNSRYLGSAKVETNVAK